MKLKSVVIIGLLIGLLYFSTFIYNSNAQYYNNLDELEIETDPDIVTRRNLILHFLRLNFWLHGAKGFSNCLGGNAELQYTFQGITAVTSIWGQFRGISLDFLFIPTVEYIEEHWNVTTKAYGRIGRNDTNLYSTYYATTSLDLIGFSNKTHPEIVDYVDSLQNADGGFGSHENESSSLSATLFAILLLKRFDFLNLTDNASDWIIQTQNTDNKSQYFGAFSSNQSDPTYTIYSTYEALTSLYELDGNISGINATTAANWVVSCQNLNFLTGEPWEYGGFGNNPNETRSNMPSSRAAVASLRLLRSLNQIKNGPLIIWVFCSQQLLFGGFSSSPESKISSVSATYHALEIIKMYSWPMLLLFTKVPWQIEPELTLGTWFLIISLTLLITIILIYGIWKRMRK